MNLFLDGASHYSTSELDAKYDGVDSNACTWTVEGAGRTDGCIKRVTTGNSPAAGYLVVAPTFTQASVWSPKDTGYYGVALKVDILSRAAGGVPGISSGMIEGAFLVICNGAFAHLGAKINPNGTIGLYRAIYGPGAPTLLETSISAITDDEWTYLEFGWFLSTSTNGTFEIRSNGTTVMAYEGRTVPSSGEFSPFTPPTAFWDSIRVGAIQADGGDVLTSRLCDTYVLDNEASDDPANPNDDFLGDVQIAYIKPTGAGNSTVWTPSAGANWQCVDEVPPNGDTDYIETTTPGDLDTYTFENVTGNPKAIQVVAYARKTDPAGASIKFVTRQDSTDYEGPERGLGSTSYTFVKQPYDTNPDTSLQWTEAEMNAGEWGPLKES